MSKDDLQKLEEILEGVAELNTCKDYRLEAHPLKADLIIIREEDIPFAIVPASARAEKLLTDWGWDTKAVGILPPDNPLELLSVLPDDYTIMTLGVLPGIHMVQEIALPSSRVVLH